jgi:hypothetical protein
MAGETFLGKEGSTLPTLRECIGCHEDFVPKRSNQLRCKLDCSRGAHHKARTPTIDRTFVSWDGEGIEDKFVLLANSQGDTLYQRSGLSTEECFEFLLKSHDSRDLRDTSNVWFSFSYDVNMMLRDLWWKNLRELHKDGRTHWKGYRIQYIPRKILRIQRAKKRFDSSDTFGFFQGSFLNSLDGWEVLIPDIIEEGKAARSDFSKWKRSEIVAYNAAEVEAHVELMNKLRRSIKEAGWNTAGWYGAGALANWFLRYYKANEHLTNLEEKLPVAHAYFGGRIDAEGWGTIEPAYHYDITSAYPWAMTRCPSLPPLKWHRAKNFDDEFGLTRIRWNVKGSESWNPFPWRAPDGSILYPPQGEGWYWNVEIQAAQRRFGKRLSMRVIESLATSGTYSYPLRFPIETAFRHRRLLKKTGNAAHVAIKLGLNSLYGKTAQRKGSQRFYSLAWAGFLTAATRAKLSDAMIETDTISTMTDSIFSRTEMGGLSDEELGGWTGEKVESLSIIEPGIYEVDGEIFTRGHERNAIPPIKEIIERFRAGDAAVPFNTTRFVGFPLALMGGDWPSLWRHFVTFDRQINNPAFDGTVKRMPLTFGKAKWNHLQPRVLPFVESSTPYGREDIVPPEDWELAEELEEEND